MKKNLGFLLALGLIFSVGCSGKGSNGDDSAPVVNPAPEVDPSSPYTRLGDGTHSNYVVDGRAHYVVRNATAWQFLYKWVTGDTVYPAPVVDFAGGDVAAAAIYQFNSGGYDVEFSHVTVNLPNSTQANIRENHPAPGSNVISMITYPYALASFASDPSQEVRFTRSILVDGTTNEMMLKMLMIGTDRKFEEMAFEEIGLRVQYQQTLPAMDPNSLTYMLSTTCPEDATQLVGFEMDLGTSQVEDPEFIFFCPEHGEYWLLDTDEINWYGPFTPGVGY